MKRYIDCNIPTETCNLRCHYCYVTQNRKFNNKLVEFKYSPEVIRKALSVSRLGGKCLLNMCANGETLLAESVIDVAEELLKEGHYVMIVTNGTLTKRFEKIAKMPKKLLNHLFFKFSFHYMELKRLNMLDVFFDNVNLMKRSGASFTVEITPSDELEEYIEDIKNISMKNLGALPHITIARKDSGDIPPLTNRSFEEYIDVWKTFDSELFNYKTTIFGKKRNEFCYAGEWSGYLNLVTGDLLQCYCGKKVDNIYKKMDEPIKFLPIGNNCTLPHCYNGHSYLVFGDIPELDAPTYAEVRNRVCLDGTEWLTPDMKAFMSSKLKESNKMHLENTKRHINQKNKRFLKKQILKQKIKNILKNYIKKRIRKDLLGVDNLANSLL